MKRLLFSIVILASSIFHNALSDEVRYEAVWNSGKATSLHTAPLSLDAFLQNGEHLAKSGLRLIDVETTIRNGQRVYAGLWTKGTGTNLFQGPISAVEMRETMKKMKAQGLRLIDFEIFRTPSGGRRYLGVWRKGIGEELLTGPMQQNAFFAKGKKLIEERGMRLEDVEVEIVNGVLLYNGLFRTASGSNFITAPLPRDRFRRKRDEMVGKRLELIDVERVTINGQDRFIGVWSSGSGESRLSRPRKFGPYFTFVQSQFNQGKHTRDFELLRIVTKPDDNGHGNKPVHPTVDPSDLPNNPADVSLTGNQRLVIEWTHDTDHPFTIELPRAWLPDWLPHKNGEPVLPDNFCALNIRHADSIFWQVPGNSAVTTPPFRATPNVSALGDEFFLGGVHFSGPFGACTGSQTQFVFRSPFTEGDEPFEPLENMRLVIEGVGSGSNPTEIMFLPADAPEAETPEAFDLFEDDTKEKLEALLETFAELFEDGENIMDYCLTVGNYWKEVCSENPAACPVAFPKMPDCATKSHPAKESKH